MASDYLLELDGIKGESNDAKHKETIEILSFSWGLSQTALRGGGGGAGKASFSDLSFTKQLDKSSPVLFEKCCTGQHIKKATLFVRKAGGEQEEYLKLTMSECLVSSYQIGGSDGGGTPGDQFSLNYTKILFEYAVQSPDGQMDWIRAGWDLKSNSKI